MKRMRSDLTAEDLLDLLTISHPELVKKCGSVLRGHPERRNDIKRYLVGVCDRLGIDTENPSAFAFAKELPVGVLHIGTECGKPNLPNEFYLPKECITSSHIFIAGETGSGKSRLIATLIIEAKRV